MADEHLNVTFDVQKMAFPGGPGRQALSTCFSDLPITPESSPIRFEQWIIEMLASGEIGRPVSLLGRFPSCGSSPFLSLYSSTEPLTHLFLDLRHGDIPPFFGAHFFVFAYRRVICIAIDEDHLIGHAVHVCLLGFS